MADKMKIGTAKVDITPENPIPLAGFAFRNGVFADVVHKIYIRVILFEEESKVEKNRGLIISGDLIWWGNKIVGKMRKRIEKEYNIDSSKVIFNATHNHSGPQTAEKLTPSLGALDKEYIIFLEDKVMEGIKISIDNLEYVIIERGKGDCNIGLNRRKVIDGKVTMTPNPDGVIDRDVNLIRFKKDNGDIKALITHFSCHANVTGDNNVSSDFPGVAMEQVEEKLGPDVVSLYLQGCCADVRPANVRGDKFYRGSDKEVVELGTKLAEEVLRINSGPMELIKPCYIEGETVKLQLPLKNKITIEELEKKKDIDGIEGEWSTLLLNNPEKITDTVPLDIILLKVGDKLSFLGMSGEIVSKYGLFVKEKYNNTVIPIGYTNGITGYIPTAEHIEQGGYEPIESTLYFGLPSIFDTEIESIIYNKIEDIVKK